MLYNVDDLSQSLLQNPGTNIDFVKHFGIPFFSQIHVGVGSTGVTAYDIFSDDGRNINNKVREVMNSITANDFVAVNEQLEILTLGWKVGQRGYFSGGIYQEFDAFAYFPKDPAVLAFEGNNDYIGQNFDFSDVSFTGEMLTVYHIGFNYKFNDELTLGARLKGYSGIFNVESIDNTGVFRTDRTPNGDNFFRHSLEDLNVTVNTSGYASLNDDGGMTVDQAAKELLSRSFFGQNVGVGIDFGFNYKMTDQFSVNGSFQDLGVVYHVKDVENYSYFGSYATDGLEPLFPELDDDEETIPYWDVFEEQLDANLRDETYANNYKYWRPLKFNAGFEFGTGMALLPCDPLVDVKPRFLNLFGMLVSGVKRPRGFTYGVTAYWDRKLNDNFRFRLAYGADNFTQTKIGVMGSVRMSNFNIYMAANDLIGFTNLAKANSASLQLGLQFIFKEL
ncbi:DUF5723 family protein [Gramella sp. AN32]|uniref:DUF5723 family protein n=1 Tax=Christiangramia antarctica TaxID=2058158 RepID=A0ABW5X532_9FLAO|nr:DUF5723 family protein [Gramella sp. AN32]